MVKEHFSESPRTGRQGTDYKSAPAGVRLFEEVDFSENTKNTNLVKEHFSESLKKRNAEGAQTKNSAPTCNLSSKK
ncbi:MAG: hypothetical protein LBJ58_04055 [Tannerellaceae bacterium]|nr:hypothetical protein [Tannerellaceae bacterium]